MAWFRRKVHLEDELSAYLDGELGDRARRSVEAHLASCDECSALLEDLRGTKQLLRQMPRTAPSRPLVLGAQHAVQRAAAPPPKRISFALAPAVSLSFLVALLFVDAIDTGGGSSNDEFASSGATTASRGLDQAQAESLPAAELAPPTDGANSAAGGTTTDDSAGGGSAGDATAGSQPGGGALGGGTAGAEEPTPATDVAAVAPAVESPDQDDGAESALSQAAPEASPLEESDDSSGGPSTLRVLQIVAAIAFVASLTAVFLPRVMGRQER